MKKLTIKQLLSVLGSEDLQMDVKKGNYSDTTMVAVAFTSRSVPGKPYLPGKQIKRHK